ncbi:MAG: TAXI family TRAP transporter solute-binding subunit [Desulfobacteraceae bacterium]|nr:MAG: TAXI family TRAP transporter solute-binding subunit [Desulfobacteraceae bacterium]
MPILKASVIWWPYDFSYLYDFDGALHWGKPLHMVKTKTAMRLSFTDSNMEVGMKRAMVVLLGVVAFAALTCSLGLAQPKAAWPKSVTVGAAPVGGTYFVWAGGFTKLLNDTMKIPGNVESTGGPVHNVQLVEDNKLDFAMVTNGPAWEGWNGEGWAKGRKYQNQRAIFPMYSSFFQMYALKKSGIQTVQDLKGKSVGVGPIGGTPATYWPLIFEAAGFKAGRIVNASSADLNSQLKDGMLEANGNSVGLPWVTITEIETTHDVNVFGPAGADADNFIAKYPYFAKAMIPKGTYKCNPDRGIETLTVWNFMVVHKSAPDDFVYEVVKNTFDHVDILISTHKSATEVKPENIIYSPVPLHPGAVKYFKEKGIQLPDSLIAK